MGYDLDALGWLQFQRLCDHGLGIDPALWSGSADDLRVAVVEDGLELPLGWGRAAGPATVVAVWVRESETVGHLASRTAGAAKDAVLITNLDVEADGPRIVVGARRLGALLDADPGLRLRVPSVLGVRALAELVPDPRASTLDVAAAHAITRVFVPTRAYDRALWVLGSHGFAVLTGPPEMGNGDREDRRACAARRRLGGP